MALWQFDIHLLPKSEVLSELGQLPQQMDRDVFDEHSWWLHYQPIAQLLSRLSEVLVEGKSWSPDIKTWGTEDGNRVDVVFECERIVDVFVRFDVRNLQRTFVTQITNIAQDLALVAFAPGMKVVEMEMGKLIPLITTSDAAHFVENPEKFFREWTDRSADGA